MKDEKQRKKLILPQPLGVGYPIVSDPMGMYTGIVKEPFETPVQDADDL